jgi:hypothetical protein
MKLVCKYCGKDGLINWGERRKYCRSCVRTFSIKKAGRNRTKKTGMYLLDRSTFRRIGSKTHHAHTTVMRGLHQELKPLPTPLDHLKKIVLKLPASWLWTASILRLKELSIMSV